MLKDTSVQAALISCCIAYLIIFMWMPQHVFWVPDTGAKFIQMQTLQIDRTGIHFKIPYQGESADPTFQYYPKGYPTGHVYPQPSANCNVKFNWRVWFTSVSKIFYQLFGITGIYLLPLGGGLMVIALSGYVAYLLQRNSAIYAILGTAFATPILIYSQTFWEHVPVVAFGLVALIAMTAFPQSQRKYRLVFVVGTALIVATALRLEMAIYTGSLGLAAGIALIAHHRSKLIGWVRHELGHYFGRYLLLFGWLAALFFLLFVARTEQVAATTSFCAADRGGVRTVTASIAQADHAIAQPETNFLTDTLKSYWSFVTDNQLFADWQPLLFVGLLLCWMGAFGRKNTQIALFTLGTLLLLLPITDVLFNSERIRFVHSILFTAPLLAALGLFGRYAFRTPSYVGTLLAHLIGLLFVVSIWAANTRIDQNAPELPEWGMRYLLMLYPLLIIAGSVLAGAFWQQSTRVANGANKLGVLTLTLLMIVGGVVNMRGLSELHLTKSDLAAYQTELEQTQMPVVTDLFWLPSALATYYVEHQMFVLSEPSKLIEWTDNTPYDSFIFVTFEPQFVRETPQITVIDSHEVAGLHFLQLQLIR